MSSDTSRILTDPFAVKNPLTVQVLGICSALAVTSQLEPSLIMGLSVTAVICVGNVVVSLIRKMIPNKIRIIAEMVVVASLVILVDLVLKAFLPDVSKKLSVFVGLIITNCIVLGRLEAFAMGNKPVDSFLDGIGNGFAYGFIITIIGAIREIFGAGSLTIPGMGKVKLIPESWYEINGGWYSDNVMMVLPPAAFVILGLLIWIQREIWGRKHPEMFED